MTDIVKTNESLPEHLQQFQASQNDGISKDDIVIPYIKKVERLSQEIKNNEAEFGDIINSITKQKLGGKVKIIPVKYFKDYKKFNKSGELEDVSKDCKTWQNTGKAINTNDTKDSAGQIVERGDWKYEYHNFYVLVEGGQIPFILSMGKTSNKEGKLFLNLMQQESKLKGLAVYTKTYELECLKKQDGNNEFCVWKVRPLEGFTDATTCAFAEEMQKSIAKFVIHEEDESAVDNTAKEFQGKVL